MKKVLLLAAMAITLGATAQSTYQPAAGKNRNTTNLAFGCKDSSVFIYAADTMFIYGSCTDSSLYVKFKGFYRRLLYDAPNGGYVKATDTAAMLAAYARFQAVVKYYDTATMLGNLLRKTDTLTMLVNRLKISDTSSMLSNYLRKSSPATNALDADSLGGIAASSYELSTLIQSTNGIVIQSNFSPRTALYFLSNINPIALTGTGTITTSAAIQATDLTATGHVATVGLTVTGGASIAAPLTVTGSITNTSLTNTLIKTNSGGQQVAAIAGVDYATPGSISADEVFTRTGAIITAISPGTNLTLTGTVQAANVTVAGNITTNTLDASGNLTASTGFFATTGSGNVISGSNTDILGSGTFLRGGSNRDKSPLNVRGYNGDSIINATLGGIYLFKNVVLSGSISGSGLSLTGIVQYSDTSSMLSPYARTTNLINSPFQGTVNITPVTSGATLSLTGNITGAAVTGSSINSTGLVQGTSLRMLNGGVGGTDRTIIVGNVLSSGNITTFGPSRNNDTLITRGDLNNTINSGSFTGTNNITSTISAANVTLGGTLKFKKGGGIVALSDPTGMNTNYTSILIQNDGASSILGVESNSAGGTIINSDAYGSLIGAANAGQPLDLIAGDTVWAKLSSGKLTVIGNVSAGGITVSGEIKSASISTTTVRSVSVLSSTVTIDATYPFNQDGIVLLGQPSSGQINAIGSNTGTNRLTYDQTPARLNVTNLAVTGTITSNGLSVAGIINTSGITATGTISANTLSASVTVLTNNFSSTGLAQFNNLQASGSIAGLLSSPNQSNISTVGILTGLLTSGNISATGNITSGTLSATGGISGTLTTAAQPNITSLGSLTNLTVSGNISAGSLTITNSVTINGVVSAQGERFNVTASNLPVLFKTTGGAANAWATNFWNNDVSGNNLFVEFGTEGVYTGRGSITYNRAGGLTVFGTTSDRRAKRIIGKVNSGALIDSLKVYMGLMNGATVARPMFIADELSSVAPYAVIGYKDAIDKKTGLPIYQQVDVSALVPLVVSEVQHLRKRLSIKDAKNKILIDKMASQQKQIDTQNNVIKLLINRINEIDKRTKK